LLAACQIAILRDLQSIHVIEMKRRKPQIGYARITKPLVRENGVLREASWDEALDRAAEGFLRNRDQRGANSLGVFSCSKSSNEVNFLATKLARTAFGNNNIDSCNRT
jgi:predicted molibdopterin-dependent oxidoreductase YjgC